MLKLPDFARFTELVRGYEPFPWQADLAARLSAGELPSVIDVPTALGKTSVIDCWAHALAAAAPRQSRPPLRLCFVVDRRLIVDAAFEHASVLERRLAGALLGVEDELGPLARALAQLSGEHPLAAVRMRGGVTWESRWLPRPDQPAVIVGTVDQFGSRLLFRGYGASARMRPIDAALVGTDAWLVIDEAHIARPLVETARRAARLQQAVDRPVARPLEVTAMSATPAGSASEDVLRADPATQTGSEAYPSAAAEARRRLYANKPVTLIELPKLKKTATVRERATQLGEMLAELALRIDPDAELVGVLCSTIAAARSAHSCLEAQGQAAALMIGRSREYERQAILDQWLDSIRVGAERVGGRRYVVATQTIEVGADLDLDAAVCEVAPLDSLVQRFGRVNRIGKRRPYCSAIAHCADYHETDPVYGEATGATWEYLAASADGDPVPVSSAPELSSLRVDVQHLDLGPLQARQLATGAPPTASVQEGYVPGLLGSDIERWAATSPAPEPDQAVAPFLRGRASSVPEVYIAWRASPPVHADSVDGWAAWLKVSRPVEWEFVAVPVWEAQALVRGRRPEHVTSDLEGQTADDGRLREDEAAQAALSEDGLLGVAYTDDSDVLVPVRAATDVAVGSHIILRSDLGGHDRWGWTGVRATAAREAVPDVADLAATRKRPVLRLQDAVLCSLLGEEASESVGQALDGLDADDPATLEELAGIAENRDARSLRDLFVRAFEDCWCLDATPLVLDDQAEAATVLTVSQRRAPAPALEAISDADEGSSSQTASPQPLEDHLQSVSQVARSFADHLGLPVDVREAISCAALWHDLGKADPRFQTMLHDGDELAAQVAPALLAKSGRDPADPLARQAARIAGVPRGFRHEAVSARIVQRLMHEYPEFVEGVDTGLVQHLVASHHGYGRPLFPALVDPAPPRIRAVAPGTDVGVTAMIEVYGKARQVDWTHPARFEALCNLYGWWGLALLETTVRLADMLVSEQPARSVETRNHDLAHAASATR